MRGSRVARALVVAASLAAALLAAPARADGDDPAALRVRDFYDTLLDTMKHAGAMHVQGRYDALAPVMLQTFDVDAMARLAIGRGLDKLDAAGRASVREAFSKLLVATFASQFDDFKGEVFKVDGDVEARGPDKLVRTRLIEASGAPVRLDYLMHGTAQAWTVTDVYLAGSISQIAAWRAKFGSVVATGGIDGLLAAMRKETSKLMSAF